MFAEFPTLVMVNLVVRDADKSFQKEANARCMPNHGKNRRVRVAEGI